MAPTGTIRSRADLEERLVGMAGETGGQSLVLGGGGIAGIAWMTGLLLGLGEQGVDLPASSDLLIGTSAGATVAAQIAGDTSLDELFQRQVDPARQVSELAPEPHLLAHWGEAFPLLLQHPDPVERTRRIGDLAVGAKTVTEATRRSVIAARLPAHDWPERTLKVVAVDTGSGEPRIFDRWSGVELVDAVAASCAVPGMWPPVSIDGHRYMDGGIRSLDNADLAIGCKTVIIISPLGTGSVPLPGDSGLADQVEALRRAGARTHVIGPDDAARAAIGRNPLALDSRAPAANADRAQGRAVGREIGLFIGAHAPR